MLNYSQLVIVISQINLRATKAPIGAKLSRRVSVTFVRTCHIVRRFFFFFFFESRDLNTTRKPTAKTHGQDCPASLQNGQRGV